MPTMLRFQSFVKIPSCTRRLAQVRCQSQHIPSHARVVIGGSGILSNVIAYHLVQYGWNDIVVIDKGK